jgi:uncharacterized protein (TIGR00255 family)
MRTINSRNLDVVLRFPKNHQDRDLEQVIRKRIAQAFMRGRVEVYVQVESSSAEMKGQRISSSLARFYWEQLQDLHRCLPGSPPPGFEDLMRCPGLFEMDENTVDAELLKNLIISVFDEVLPQVKEMRRQEGEALFQDCMHRLALIRQELSTIESRKDRVVEEYRQKLTARIQELLKGSDIEIDQNRLMQEAAFMSERCDITEEIVRLQSHTNQMEAFLVSSEQAEGRRLDFLSQELHREVNTIGSKSNDLQIAEAVVNMKSEIGKLKEQIQNVE